MAMDLETLRLMHLHGDERFPMREGAQHDAAAHDPERSWMSGARIFRCTRCDEEVVVMPPGPRDPDGTPA